METLLDQRSHRSDMRFTAQHCLGPCSILWRYGPIRRWHVGICESLLRSHHRALY
jgi:hypothetical protein